MDKIEDQSVDLDGDRLRKLAEQADRESSSNVSMRIGKSASRIAVPSSANKFKPPVRSVSLREPGQKRATRLIYLPSLNAYLDRLADEQAAEAMKLAKEFERRGSR